MGLILVCLYEGLLRTGRVAPGHGVGQFQKNVVKTEAFVFGQPPQESVAIVGSSLANNLMASLLPLCPAQDLAMPGESSLTGMALIARNPHRVRRAVVELSQALSVDKDPKLTAIITAPFTAIAVRNVWALRQEFQPADVLSRCLAKSTGGAPAPATGGPMAQAIRGPVIEKVVALFSAPPFPAEVSAYRANLVALRAEVDEAIVKGVSVELFWPPIDSAINESPRETTWRRMALAEFPADHYHWLTIDYHGPTRTNDGYHLVADDARGYAAALATALSE